MSSRPGTGGGPAGGRRGGGGGGRGPPPGAPRSGWGGTGERTTVEGVRGTRSSASGITFVRRYEATVPRSSDGVVTFEVPARGSVSWRLPEFRVLRGGAEAGLAPPGGALGDIGDFDATFSDAYVGIDAAIDYDAEAARLKESVTISALPPVGVAETLAIQTLLFGYGDLFAEVRGEAAAGGILPPLNNGDGTVHGYAYVFFGPLDVGDATPDVRIRGTAPNARHGYSVAAGKF